MDDICSEQLNMENFDLCSTSIRTFNQYYPNAFSQNSNKILIIPSSNDLTAKYFYGKFDDDDHPSRYEPVQLSKTKRSIELEITKLTKEGFRLLKMAENTIDENKKEQLTINGNEIMEKAKTIKVELERTNQPWNKLQNIQKNREKDTITKLISAFRNAGIDGILILSPQNSQELKNFVAEKCSKHLPGMEHNFLNELSQYPEICDCIYFHPILGIYNIEVKAAIEFIPMKSDETKMLTTKELKDKLKNRPYDKAVHQLIRTVLPNKEGESMSLLQKLYMIITGSDDIPRISGVVCTPNAKISAMATENNKNLDCRFHHFDADLLTSIDKFHQFWATEMSRCDLIKARNLFDDVHYRKFIATIANCSVGRELFGINNALRIAKMINAHEYDPTMMTKKTYNSISNGEKSETIFLNAKQMEILNDQSKLKFVYGLPGTGKTTLIILAAIEAKKNKRKVTVLTQPGSDRAMKKILNANECNIDIGIEPLVLQNHIFVDECSTEDSMIQHWLDTAKNQKNCRLFVAISALSDIDELWSVEKKIKKLLTHEIDYGIFQLTEILRGTKSIIDFWTNRLKTISPNLQMECGHSIVGENVDYRQYLTSNEIVKQMVQTVNELLVNNDPKTICIVCTNNDEKRLIENQLKSERILFGLPIEQEDADPSLIAVALRENVYSLEWTFIICIAFFPFDSLLLSIIPLSRAIAHLTFIERDEKKIRMIVRHDQRKTEILSSIDEYERFRTETQLFDDTFIMFNDLTNQIVADNHFPRQIKHSFPIDLNNCDSFDEFFYKIVYEEQWMFLLFVYQFDYLQEIMYSDASNRLTYKPSTEWIVTYEIEACREQQLTENIKRAIELINKFNQIKDKMDAVIDTNQNLFDIFENSQSKRQYDIIAYSIHQLVSINSFLLHRGTELNIDMNEIDDYIEKLLQNLIIFVDSNPTAPTYESDDMG